MLLLSKLYSTYIRILCSLGCIVCFISFSAENTQSDQLNTLKQQISTHQQTVKQVNKQTKKIEKQLKSDDLAISVIAKALNSTESNLRITRQKLSELNKQKQQLSHQQKQQEKLLAKQLQSAYTSGNHDYIKLLLNQDKPSDIQRNVTYYQYINNARINEIQTFKHTIQKLTHVVTEQQEKSEKLTQLKSQQTIQQNNLQQAKLERTKTIKKLNNQLSTTKKRLAKLIDEEENLVAEIQRLAEQAKRAKATVKLNGLSHVKAKLSWPVKGKIQHTFGSKKQGYLTWKGVVISASLGKEVHSIYDGKVLFSDWLKGYGLVTVIDHGDGYMSLYGHNQALLKSVGDTVKKGEAIALVGQSGGQNSSSLYFEVRYNGQAVNAKTWCK